MTDKKPTADDALTEMQRDLLSLFENVKSLYVPNMTEDELTNISVYQKHTDRIVEVMKQIIPGQKPDTYDFRQALILISLIYNTLIVEIIGNIQKEKSAGKFSMKDMEPYVAAVYDLTSVN